MREKEIDPISNALNCEDFQGGQVGSHLPKWNDLTSDQNILNIVSGYRLEFSEKIPNQTHVPHPYKFTTEEKLAIDEEIHTLLEKNVIEKCDHQPGEYISNIFTREKKDGKYTMILNLSELNKNLTYYHFKMDTFETVTQLLTKDCFMASLDLKDAYYSIPIHPLDRKFLRFQWNGELFQFRALPNGLSPGPRIFTKVLKVPLTVLRSMGHVIVAYIDDTLLIGESESEIHEAVHDTTQMFSDLGFVIHPTKSKVNPTQKIYFLGFDIDSQSMIVKLTQEKETEITEFAKHLLAKRKITVRQLACFIGKVVAALPACEHGKMHYRALERDKISRLKLSRGDFDAHLILSVAAKADLQWWIDNTALAVRHLQRNMPQMEIQSDASGLGWGATNGKAQCGGRWKAHETLASGNNINYLELLAALFALKAFCREMHDIHVLMRLDNTTAVTYINDMGGIKSVECNALAITLWSWCIERNIWVTAAHLPGAENTIADRRSRTFRDETEWMLNPRIFVELCNIIHRPQVDMFASRLNTQLPMFVSWQPDPEAFAIDAFTLNWGKLDLYAFPPFCLVDRCLKKPRGGGGGGGGGTRCVRQYGGVPL